MKTNFLIKFVFFIQFTSFLEAVQSVPKTLKKHKEKYLQEMIKKGIKHSKTVLTYTSDSLQDHETMQGVRFLDGKK